MNRTYGDVLTLTNSGQGMTTNLTVVQDGFANSSPMFIATNKVNFDRSGGNEFQLDGLALTSSSTNINSSTKNNPIFLGTGGATMPSGTTAQRDPSPSNGEIRYNTDIGALEAYQENVWGGLGADSVLGPVSSTTNDIVVFADTDVGSLLADSGVNISAVPPPLLILRELAIQ